MTRSEVWQIGCATLAIVFALGATLRLIRSPRPHVGLLLAQIILVPEAALVAEVVHPGPVPDGNQLLVVIAVLGVAAFVVMGWSLYARRKLMTATVTLDVLGRQHLAAFASRILVVLMMSGFQFTFAPGFALANLALNAVWIGLWIPQRWRRVDVEVTEEIRAPVHIVFEEMTDANRWRSVQEGTIAVEPAGLLRVGTEIVRRQELQRLDSNPNLARQIESRSVVTSLVPDRGYTTALVGHQDQTAGIELTQSAGGTHVRSWAKSKLSVREAAAGLRFELRAVVATRISEMRQSVLRLKQASEAAPSQ